MGRNELKFDITSEHRVVVRGAEPLQQMNRIKTFTRLLNSVIRFVFSPTLSSGFILRAIYIQ